MTAASHLNMLPPQAIEMERSVLGMMLSDSSVLETIMEVLAPKDFYHPHHAAIYEGICLLSQQGYPTDIISLSEQLRKAGTLDGVGGVHALVQLAQSAISSMPVLHHALVVKEKYLKREQVRIAGELLKMAYGPDDVFDTFEHTEQQLFALSNVSKLRDIVPVAKVAGKVMKHIAEARTADTDLSGIPTGFRDLDLHTNGWQRSDLIIIAARPGVGKTAFSLNLALNCATHALKPAAVALFNLEMEDTQVVKRALAASSGIPLSLINRPRSLGESDMSMLQQATAKFKGIPLFIEDTPALTTMQLRSKMRRYIKKHNIGLVILDYLQLMGSHGKAATRENEVSRISRDLKIIAKELKVPIIALSQLNRDIEKRTDKAPNLADLRESGAIEQDADMILFLYRPAQETIQEKPIMGDKVILSCKKHRNGDLFESLLRFDKTLQRFTDAETGSAIMAPSPLHHPSVRPERDFWYNA